jgi:hypothetical protein
MYHTGCLSVRTFQIDRPDAAVTQQRQCNNRPRGVRLATFGGLHTEDNPETGSN